MFPLKIKNRRGQSGLEYLALATLVMLGIIVMGPYVVRSINAPFKTLEEGAKDSQREVIRQAAEDNTLKLPTCECNFERVGCGSSTNACRTMTDPETYAYYRLNCNPQGCQADLQRLGVITHSEECRTVAPPTDCCKITDSYCGYAAINVPPYEQCPYGTRRRTTICGSLNPSTTYSCVTDPTCNFTCATKPANSEWCDISRVTERITSNNQPVNVVANGQCGMVQDKTCLAQCDGCSTLVQIPSSHQSICQVANTILQWDTPGTYTWTVPAGVRNIAVTAIGAGGGGGGTIFVGGDTHGGQGGGSGGIQADIRQSVSPGDILTIVVGTRGGGGGYWYNGYPYGGWVDNSPYATCINYSGCDGTASSVQSATFNIQAGGGAGGMGSHYYISGGRYTTGAGGSPGGINGSWSIYPYTVECPYKLGPGGDNGSGYGRGGDGGNGCSAGFNGQNGMVRIIWYCG